MSFFRRRSRAVPASIETAEPVKAASGRDEWRKLYKYWRSKHVDGRPPAQSDLDPVLEIPRLLPVLTLLTVLPDGYEYRLAGTAVVDYVGCEMRGRKVGSLDRLLPTRQQWINVLDHVRADQKPRLVTSHFLSRLRTDMVTLVLPLVDQTGRTERLLTGTFFDKYAEADIQPDKIDIQEIVH